MIRAHVVPVRNIKNAAADNYIAGRNSVPWILYMFVHLFKKMERDFFTVLAGVRDRIFDVKLLRWKKDCAGSCLVADPRRAWSSGCDIFNYSKCNDSKAGGNL